MINEVITASGMAHDQNLDWKQQQEAIRTGIKQRLTELDSSLSIRSTQSDVLNRAGNKVSVKVIHLGEIGKIAAGSSPQDCGFLQQTLDGHLFISGVEFDAKHVADLSADTLSLLPVDLDGSLVKKALSEKRTVMGWLKAGGGFVIPILAIALLALFLGVERLYSLYTLRSSPALINTVLADLQSHKNDEALEKVANENSPLSRILKCGLESINDGREVRMAKLETAILDEEPRLERSMGLLAALAAIAPLLGLLGTVTGMISTFDVIAQYGTSNPKLLSGGISVALITTQLGLMVAVPILLFHAWLSRIIERRMVILEQAINALLGIEKADS
ncbi:MAG: MotA/TolQ/ExbB proton channel family protein [Lentisphaeria bacterium]|nr:MotA/TolQ/ExbB proton channel family protein [Lentisphaeria bacterium]